MPRWLSTLLDSNEKELKRLHVTVTKVNKLESEYEEAAIEEPGYTIIGGEEIEVLPEESADIGDDMGSDEE